MNALFNVKRVYSALNRLVTLALAGWSVGRSGQKTNNSLSRESEEPAAHLAPPGGPLLC